jgi:N-acetylglucosamine-6-phosphate deacetylase
MDTLDGTSDSILGMSKSLIQYGVTSFCPTLYPQDDKIFLNSIRNVVNAMGHEEGAKILGMHLEGPFISRSQTGVQLPQYMREVDLELMQKYWDASEGIISIMTVAPELKGMRSLALYCRKKGIVLSAGHSNASYDNMREGMEAGIVHSTHFFNAMRALHHRDPGVVGAIMIHPEVSCEIIGDGVHVHPALIKLLLSVKPKDKILLVTDSLRPTGQKEGDLYANNEKVYLKDGIFYRVSDDVIAGSSLTMNRGIKNLMDMGIDKSLAIQMATKNPSLVLNKQNELGSLIPGKAADIAVFDDNLNIEYTIVNGNILYSSRSQS